MKPLFQRATAFASQVMFAISFTLFSLYSYAEGGGGLSSVNLPKPKSQSDGSFFGDFFAYISDGFKFGGAVASALVFMVCVVVWISEFQKVQETGKGWGKLVAFFVVGIILIIVVFWGVSKMLEVLSKVF